jgi:TonB-linked SusC/RagA family outer membrane protein
MPNYPVYDNDGKYNWVNGVRNFLASFDAYVKSYTNDLNTSFDLSYSLLPNLEVKYLLGFNKLTTKQVRVQPSTSFMPGTTALPSSAFNNAYNQDLISEPQINYRVNVGKSNLNITAGATLQQNERNIETINVSNYTSDINLENPRFGTPAVTATKTPYRYLSVYSRVNYNVSDRYLLNISFRRDGSTRFGPSNKFGNFYSIGGGWLFYKSIDAFKYIKWLSFGKLRASYGLTGSDGIPDYKFKSLYSSSSLYGTSYTIIPSQVANKDFGWERTKKAEIGLDLGFLKDKIVVSAGFYRNRSDNQLVSYTLPSITGFTGYTANLPATIQNQGLELEIKTDNVTSRNFNWTTSLNFTIARNKLISFPGIESSSYGSSYVVGKSLNIVQRFNFLGINQNDGSAILEDVNKDNSYTQTSAYNKQNGDFIIAGSTDPKFFGGMGNTLSYKGLELDLFVQFVKQDGYNVFGQGSPSFGRNFNLTTYYLDYWKSPNDGSSLPKPLGASNVGLNNFFSSTAGFGDASFIRLKNVQVNYTLPNRVIKKLKIESVRVFIQGQNLLTFTKYKGYDPEQASSSSIVIPTLRTITAGIKCSL